MAKFYVINEKGAVLVIALLIMAVLSLIGAAATMTSTIEIKIAGNQETSKEAFYVAEAGIEHAKSILKDSTNGFNDELATGTILNVNFGEGTYTVQVTDNNDETSPTPNNPLDDVDNKVVVTSTGKIHGAVKTIEVVVNRIQISITPDGAFGIYGNGTEVKMRGKSSIDGGDSVAGLYTSSTPDEVEIEGASQVLGSPPIQVGDGTYTGQDWENLANQLIPLADITISGGNISGNQTLGTPSDPQITVVSSDADFRGTVDGAGILIVRDEVEFRGNFQFEGLIIILGDEEDAEAELDLGAGGRPRLFGAVVLAGSGESEVELRGNAGIIYSEEALLNANDTDSLFNVVSWRETY